MKFLWAPIANLLVWFYTVVLGTIALLCRPFDSQHLVYGFLARLWCRLILVTVRARVTVEMSGPLPKKPAVFMANHTSVLDIPALFSVLPTTCRFIAKKELFYIPFLGWNLWAAGHFPVDRSNPRKTIKSIKRVVQGIREGKSLVVFPEGTRSATGVMGPFKTGSFKIAVRARVPIVPVSIRGAHRALPKGSFIPTPSKIQVVIGSPIDTQGYSEDRFDELIDLVQQAIGQGIKKAGHSEEAEASFTVRSASGS